MATLECVFLAPSLVISWFSSLAANRLLVPPSLCWVTWSLLFFLGPPLPTEHLQSKGFRYYLYVLKTLELVTPVWSWDAGILDLYKQLLSAHLHAWYTPRWTYCIHWTCYFSSLHPDSWWQLQLSSCSGQKSWCHWCLFFYPKPNSKPSIILLARSSKYIPNWTTFNTSCY